jgi:hypothetical protein
VGHELVFAITALAASPSALDLPLCDSVPIDLIPDAGAFLLGARVMVLRRFQPARDQARSPDMVTTINGNAMPAGGAKICTTDEESRVELRRKSSKILDFRRISVSGGLFGRLTGSVDGEAS